MDGGDGWKSCVEVEATAESWKVMKASMQVDLLPPWKLVESSMQIDLLPWKLVEASIETDGSRLKLSWK